MVRSLIFALSALFLASALWGVAPGARVSDMRLAEHDSFTRAVIELDSAADYRIHNYSAGQGFITIEVRNVTASASSVSSTKQERLVTDSRVAHDGAASVLRLHLRTAAPVRTQDFTLKNPDRIVVDLYRSAGSSGDSSAGPVASVPLPPSRPNSGWRQRIIIDPGHGGHHKGGVGKLNGRTVYEKDVVMAVSERLERLLRADPRFDVDMTRRSDVYIGLVERTRIAARMRGDMFVSIHTNAVDGRAAQQRARGFEIWIWNRDSNHSAAARAVAAMENAEPGVTKENTSILTRMMIDALESQALVSRKLARTVHAAFMADPYFRRHDRGIDSARFKVLENYDMPSILVELGFITHPEEVKHLFDPAFQQRCAQYLYDGIVRYYEMTDPTFPRQVAQSATRR